MKQYFYIISIALVVTATLIVTGCESPFNDDDSTNGNSSVSGNISSVDGNATPSIAGAAQVTEAVEVIVYLDDYVDMQTLNIGESFVFSNIAEGTHTVHFLCVDIECQLSVSVGSQTDINYVNIQMASSGNITYDSVNSVNNSPTSTDANSNSNNEASVSGQEDNSSQASSDASNSSTIQYKKYDLKFWPISGRITEIDINDDGDADISIYGGSTITADVPKSSRNTYISLMDTTCVLTPYTKGVLIDGYQTWVDARYRSLANQWERKNGSPEYTIYPWEGYWAYTSDKYMPIQITENGSVHYGWIRMTFPQGDGWLETYVTVHDCAYETLAGKSIVAGSR